MDVRNCFDQKGVTPMRNNPYYFCQQDAASAAIILMAQFYPLRRKACLDYIGKRLRRAAEAMFRIDCFTHRKECLQQKALGGNY
jgi:hypothetical protein